MDKHRPSPHSNLGEGPPEQKNDPPLSLAGEGPLGFKCPSDTTPFPRRGSYGMAEAGGLASTVNRLDRSILCRYSCGTAPDLVCRPHFTGLSPSCPLLPSYRAPLPAVFCCEASIARGGLAVKRRGARRRGRGRFPRECLTRRQRGKRRDADRGLTSDQSRAIIR